MLNGSHVILYTKDAAADRAFFRDVLKLPCIDDGGGWLIFALPVPELGIHPDTGPERAEFYLMTDDVAALVATLKGKGIACTEPNNQGWGTITMISLPGGGRLGIYQPHHKRPPAWKAAGAGKPAKKKPAKAAPKKKTVKKAAKKKK